MPSLFLRFPGGRAKALTLSYDDGVKSDLRLIEIMQRHGLKGTFNINAGLFPPEGVPHGRLSREGAYRAYHDSGMEVAVHGYTHPYLEQLSPGTATYEIARDREGLESLFGTIIRGAAYPYGTYHDGVVEALRCCGIVYCRTVVSTEKFDLPTDWLRLPATCHHKNPRLMELAKQFLEMPADRTSKLFYLWGHSYEFDNNHNWEKIEQFAEYMGGRDNVWHATNIEIYDYIDAFHRLQFSMDGKRVYNPTNTTLYFDYAKQPYHVAPGEQLSLA
ncbi:MAG: polysaccharide deacetylase family protein [Eubacteriales bacterium]